MLGERLKRAREAAGLRQIDAANAIGLSESGVSDMENDRREPKVSQLSQLAKLYHRSVDFFLSEAPIAQDAVLWRCMPSNQDDAKSIQREFYKLCEDYREIEELTEQAHVVSFPSDDTKKEEYEYPQAELLAVRTHERLDLGAVPAEALRRVLEERYYVKIFALPMGNAGSSLCAMSDSFGAAILLNQDSVHWRRNYDLAHELFHLLTWKTFSDDNTSRQADTNEESLADVFASRLLLPERPFLDRVSKHMTDDKLTMTLADLHGIARSFDVSVQAVVYRLAGLLRWRKEQTKQVVEKLQDFYSQRERKSVECLPQRFVYLTAQAYRQGLVSFNKAASYLRLEYKEAESELEPPGNGIDLDSQVAAAGN